MCLPRVRSSLPVFDRGGVLDVTRESWSCLSRRPSSPLGTHGSNTFFLLRWISKMDLFEYKPSHPILTLRARAALRRAGATACQRRSYDLSLEKKASRQPLGLRYCPYNRTRTRSQRCSLIAPAAYRPAHSHNTATRAVHRRASRDQTCGSGVRN